MLEILIVDDDRLVREGLSAALLKAGYASRTARDGSQALGEVGVACPSLVLLDVMMPGMDGFETCRRIRELNPEVPILFLSAYDATDNRVRGLRLGADDFLPKTMSLDEMLLRVEAVLRRTGSLERTATFRFGNAVVDPAGHFVLTPEGERKDLSSREVALLRTCVAHCREVLSDEYCTRVIWGRSADVSADALKQVVHRLRAKLGTAQKCLTTVSNVGYRYDPNPSKRG